MTIETVREGPAMGVVGFGRCIVEIVEVMRIDLLLPS